MFEAGAHRKELRLIAIGDPRRVQAFYYGGDNKSRHILGQWHGAGCNRCLDRVPALSPYLRGGALNAKVNDPARFNGKCVTPVANSIF